MGTKLHIDLTQGILEVEGDPDFVREIYQDFKERIATNGASPHSIPQLSEPAAQKTAPAKPKRRSATKKKNTAEGEAGEISADEPNIDKNLDTSTLSEYFSRYEPKNHPEKILIFLKFLIDELGIEAPNTDQVYTCYEAVDERIPRAFAQAFRDTSGRKFGFIDFNSATDLKITTLGSNHFKFDLKKKSVE